MTRPNLMIVAPGIDRHSDLAGQLRDFGCDVTLADALPEGLAKISSQRPDLVFVAANGDSEAAWDFCWRAKVQVQDGRSPMFVVYGSDGSAVTPDGSAAIEKLARQIASFVVRNDVVVSTPGRIAHLGLEIDTDRHQIQVDGRRLQLTPTEFRLLCHLAQTPGYVRSRAQLAQASTSGASQVQERTVDAHIKSLRRKLGQRADLIETVRGIGYRLRD